jgi:uncharacterized membrane protein YqiK
MTIVDELKEAKHEAAAQRVRADRFAEVAKAERDKRKKLQEKIKAIEAAAFARGSALTVAHYRSVLPDDEINAFINELVLAGIQKRKSDPATVAKLVEAVCSRHGIEPRGDRSIIELVYQAQSDAA